MARSMARVFGVAVVAAALTAPVVVAQTGTQSLGSVNVSRRVLANGQALAAGTYTLRLLPDDLPVVVGQTRSESRWVEFVRGGKVMGREVATVVTGPEAKSVLKGGAPAAGSSKTEMLKGNDYLRIWVRRGATNYLIHLVVPKT